MRFIGKSLTGLLVLALSLGILGYAGTVLRDAVTARSERTAPERSAPERVYTVEVIAARPDRIVPVTQAFGRVQARRVLELRAAVPGRVTWVAPDFADGADVAAGDTLVRIDATEAEAAQRGAEADLAEAEAELRAATRAITLTQDDLAAAEAQVGLRERALDRQRDLIARAVGAQAALDEAELALSAARQTVLARRQALATAEDRRDRAAIGVDRARLAVEEAARRVADTVITAPFAGVLDGVAPIEGRLLSQSEPIGTLVDLTRPEVGFRLSAAQFADLIGPDGALIDTPVRAMLDVADLTLVADGRLDRAAPRVAEGETGRQVYARLDAAAGLQPGDFVTVLIDGKPLDDAVALPAAALDGNGVVLVVGPENRLEERRVTTLHRQGDTVLVAGDTLAGASVVAQRTPLLGAGIRVDPRDRPGPDRADLIPDTMLALAPDRRERLKAFVAASGGMAEPARARILAQLDEPLVPARMVARLEARMDG